MRFCMDLCLAVVLIQIAWTDIRTMMIPDRVLVPLMILAGLSVFTEPEIPFTARLIGIFCTALPMYLANLFVDGAFGGGDIRLLAAAVIVFELWVIKSRLLAAAGFCLGWKTCLIGTITGLFLGGLQSVVLLALGKVRFGERARIPFAPALCMGLFAARLFEDQIVSLFFWGTW